MNEELITLSAFVQMIKQQTSAQDRSKMDAVFQRLREVYAYDNHTSYPKDALQSNYDLVYMRMFDNKEKGSFNDET